MLNIYFGDMPEAVYNTSVYFNYTYEDEWLTVWRYENAFADGK